MLSVNISNDLEENQKFVREMVLDSRKDIEAGKGRDYREFFEELEKRYYGAKQLS